MTELTQTASFLGYAFVGFVVALYLPHIIFKFLAELHVDLGWRRDTTRLEEFIGAALPSVVLNVFAWVTYELICFLPFLDSYDVDWAVVASIFAADKGAFADYIYAGEMWWSIGLYLAILYAIAGANGWLYGLMIHTALQRNEDPLTLRRLTSSPIGWRTIPEGIGWLWHIFYQETLVPFASWTVRETWVMVRTVDKRLYHGRFARYDKNVTGAFEMIRLDEVRRYCFDEIQQRYSRGQIAVSDFDSTLHIKWSQIADINVVDPNKIFDIMYTQYQELKKWNLERGLPPPDVPKGLELPPEEQGTPEDDISPS